MTERFDPTEFRRILGHYPTGVCAITAIDEGVPVAMVVGSFTSASLDPPLVGFFPDRKSTSWPRIRAAGRFCVNVLAEDQREVCRALAARSADKFDGVSYGLSDMGLPVLLDAVAWIDCDLHAVHDAGDHFISIGLVRSLQIEHTRRPLLFFKGGYGQFAPLTHEASSIR